MIGLPLQRALVRRSGQSQIPVFDDADYFDVSTIALQRMDFGRAVPIIRLRMVTPPISSQSQAIVGIAERFEREDAGLARLSIKLGAAASRLRSTLSF